jgi:hypothetical protein
MYWLLKVRLSKILDGVMAISRTFRAFCLAEATEHLPLRDQAGRLTGLAYPLTHEELRTKVIEFTAQSYEFGEQWLTERKNG